eukprot:TRINITY_DN69620_c0_g1_i1.p2 TRINITY_DN69620_c0_g1~~TRINITY_DN69620_c0_g1_i1.p2  ORF type:complete len:101 (-),score=28.81 TRINITY_DN69620_c0_g1_i1:90-392(-)
MATGKVAKEAGGIIAKEAAKLVIKTGLGIAAQKAGMKEKMEGVADKIEDAYNKRFGPGSAGISSAEAKALGDSLAASLFDDPDEPNLFVAENSTLSCNED